MVNRSNPAFRYFASIQRKRWGCNLKTKTSRLASRVMLLLISSFFLLLGQFAANPLAYAQNATPVVENRQVEKNLDCLQPPQNVNLMTLSDTQLQSYGLPNRATIEGNPKKWSRLLAHAKHRSCSSIPTEQQNQIPTASCPAPTSQCTSYNWAGNEAQGSRGTYREGSVEFIAPSISTSISDAEVALWAGVGGDPKITSSPVLVQAGLLIYVNNNREYFETFWEVVPGFNITNLPLPHSISVNDDLYFDIQSNSLTYPNQDYFYVENYSRSDYASHILNTMGTQYNSDSATGECIVERIGGPNGLPLAQFQENGQAKNTVLLTNCGVGIQGQGGVQPIGSFPHHYNVLIDANGSTMSTVGPITNGGWNYTITWVRGT